MVSLTKSLAKRQKRKIKKKVIKQYEKKPMWEFTPRQFAYRKNRFELGMTQIDAAVAAGYSEKYARKKAHIVDRVVKVGIIDELNRAGATDRAIATHLTKIAMTAEKRVRCEVTLRQEDGETIVENNASVWDPDLNLRKDTWETIAKLKKHLSNQPIIDQSRHTHLTVLLDEGPDGSRTEIKAHTETNLSLQTADLT